MLLLLALCTLRAADTPTDPGLAWATRAESSAVRLRTAAEQLAQTAHGIAAAGRVQQLGVLHSDAAALHTRADQLALWARQAPSLEGAGSPVGSPAAGSPADGPASEGAPAAAP